MDISMMDLLPSLSVVSYAAPAPGTGRKMLAMFGRLMPVNPNCPYTPEAPAAQARIASSNEILCFMNLSLYPSLRASVHGDTARFITNERTRLKRNSCGLHLISVYLETGNRTCQ